MDSRIFTLLIVIYSVAYAHTSHDGASDLTTIIQMITGLQQHVLSFEEEIKGKMMDYQESLSEQINDKFSYFEGKMVDIQGSLNAQNDRISNFEGKMVDYQESLTEQYDQIQVKLQVDEVGTINNYYGCGNSSNMPPFIQAQDCEELLKMGITSDGVYPIYVDGTTINVYCDMTNGGWIVLQKRTDDTVNYDRDFVDYEEGFGDVSGEHWLGLRQMNLLTESESSHWIVRFDLEDFYNETRWEEYSEFRISAGSDYTLTFDESSHRGTAGDTGDGLSFHNGMKFTSRDRDQDEYKRSCADSFHGGWWYHECLHVITTGMPYGGSFSIEWDDWNYPEPLKSAIIKIKRA